MYKKISGHFQSHCIIDNIREESSKHGLETLQEQILSRLLNTKVKVQSIEEGKNMIRSRLSNSSVLILLDDIDDRKQLDALAGSHNWFGNGSRIIITTRDEHLLQKVDHVFPVILLTHEEASKLFNKRAYNEKKPVKGYETLSSSVVSYAAGLPLALNVLGSFLYDKNEKEWRSTLCRLKDNPDMEIVEKLKISYDGLKNVEKELFLDIVCFFRWGNIDKATEVFEACGYHPDIGIEVLKQKALITIVDGKFDMHDLIQEMGHNIVRGEHPNNPEKHSRVWKDEEIKNMFHGDASMENYKIEAIQYDGDPSLFCKIVSNMKRVRWLSLTKPVDYVVKNVEVPSFLSNELCYIHLEFYPKSPFPESFQPMKLATLKLVYSLQKKLWNGCKHLPHLKVLELFKMENLLYTPDFGGLPCLRKLTLKQCKRLMWIHPSLGNHACLEDVCVSFCDRVDKLPTIVHMGKLKTLEIYQCDDSLEFPEIKSNMESLVKLTLNNMWIDVVLSSIGEGRFPNLISLHLSFCSLKNKGANYCVLEHLEEFKLIGIDYLGKPNHLHSLLIDIVMRRRERYRKYRSAGLTWLSLVLAQSTCTLRELDLSYCDLRDGEIPPHIGELSNLRKLALFSNSFSRLDFSLLQLTRLKHLKLSSCHQLVELPELPSSLAILEADDCTSLTTIGDFYKKCKWLCQVSLTNMNIISDIGILLDSMLRGMDIENHSMLLRLEGLEIAKRFTPLVRGGRYTLNLPENWRTDFCGFLMCVVMEDYGTESFTFHSISMKPMISGMDSEDDVVWEESEGGKYTWVFYVSFATLSHTPWWNSNYKAISIHNIHRPLDLLSSSKTISRGFGVALVARESGSGPTKTTSTKQEESEISHYTPKFEISHDSAALQISFPNDRFDAIDFH